jgi:NADH:ubiquinone oxidoreductase subunit 4 (subunit M)
MERRKPYLPEGARDGLRQIGERTAVDGIQKFLLILGGLLILLALAWPLVKRLGLGRLPGDIHMTGDGWSVHILLGTSILISILLTLLLNLIFWWLNR